MTAKRSDQSKSDLPAKLSQPAQRALAGAGIKSLKQLTRFSEPEIKKLHGIGPNAMNQLNEALAARGLSFAVEKKKKA
jgi:DNA-directed RNA polymerase alpha subunit